jgi:MtaA/CmuA family methyltransferase
MLGLTETLMLIYEDPQRLRKALEWRTSLAVAWADALVDLGADCVWIGEGAASSSIISPDNYAEFVLPYASIVVNHLKKRGVVTIMHVCGDINQSAGIIARTGVDAMDIDHMVDIQAVRKAIDRTVCLRGNLNPLDLITMTREQILKKCLDIIDQAGSPFVLGTGCVVARDTDPGNIEAMVDASLEHGKKKFNDH